MIVGLVVLVVCAMTGVMISGGGLMRFVHRGVFIKRSNYFVCENSILLTVKGMMKRRTTKNKSTRRRHTTVVPSAKTHIVTKRKSKKTSRQQTASVSSTAHLSTDRTDVLKRFYDIRYFKKHDPTWQYHLTTPRKVHWLATVRTKPLSATVTKSLEYRLKELLVSHWGDTRLRPELTPTFCVAEILAKHNFFQYMPFLHFNRVMEYWKMYGELFIEQQQATAFEVADENGSTSKNSSNSSSSLANKKEVLRYRYIGNISPDVVMKRLNHIWKNHTTHTTHTTHAPPPQPHLHLLRARPQNSRFGHQTDAVEQRHTTSQTAQTTRRLVTAHQQGHSGAHHRDGAFHGFVVSTAWTKRVQDGYHT